MSTSSVSDTDSRPGDTPDSANSQESSLRELVGISGPVPRWIPMMLLAFSSVAIVAPVILFRRYKANLGHSHVDAHSLCSAPVTSTAPPRRGRLRGSGDDNASPLETPLSAARSSVSTPPLRSRRKVQALPSSSTHLPQLARVESSFTASETPAAEEDHFNAPLYTLKAFSIATAMVISSAAATVAGVMSYLDVRDTTEFGARMRMWVSDTMPVLSAQIYRRPTPRDSLPDVALLPSPAPSESEGSSTMSTTFDHDASQQRLADAFDKGGFDAWAEVAERELEAELEMERSRKKQESSETN